MLLEDNSIDIAIWLNDASVLRSGPYLTWAGDQAMQAFVAFATDPYPMHFLAQLGESTIALIVLRAEAVAPLTEVDALKTHVFDGSIVKMVATLDGKGLVNLQ